MPRSYRSVGALHCMLAFCALASVPVDAVFLMHKTLNFLMKSSLWCCLCVWCSALW